MTLKIIILTMLFATRLISLDDDERDISEYDLDNKDLCYNLKQKYVRNLMMAIEHEGKNAESMCKISSAVAMPSCIDAKQKIIKEFLAECFNPSFGVCLFKLKTPEFKSCFQERLQSAGEPKACPIKPR